MIVDKLKHKKRFQFFILQIKSIKYNKTYCREDVYIILLPHFTDNAYQ